MYRHHFKDTETDICSCSQNTPETVEHFLLFCPQYNLIRSQLFEKLKKVISLATLISPSYPTNLFIYGNSSLHFRTNQQIIEHTINFIMSSKRFDGAIIRSECNAIPFNVFSCFIICKRGESSGSLLSLWLGGAGRWGRLDKVR